MGAGLTIVVAAVQDSPPRMSSFFKSPSFVHQESGHCVPAAADDRLIEKRVIRGRGAREAAGGELACIQPSTRHCRYAAFTPTAAPLPPAPRRFAIRLPRPRGIGVAGG